VVRAPCSFRQLDITRAIRAIEASGHKAGRVEIENGKIVVTIADESDARVAPVGDDPERDWAEDLKK
jgi:hypothetical protein